MQRRKFITLLGAATAAWPLAAHAQQPERMRRIGVLMSLAADDSQGQARLNAFVQGLQELGWTEGRNLQIDSRWAAGEGAQGRKYAAELVALAPDAILASGGSVVGPLLQATHTVPIVFTQTPDPVGAGFVDSLARPGGNSTGFSAFDYSIGGKWLELLKQVAPGVTRVAVIRDPGTPQGIGQFSAVQSLAPSLGLEVSPINARNAGEMERDIAAIARVANSGLIVTGAQWQSISASPLCLILSAMRVKSPFSQSALFGFIGAFPFFHSTTGSPEPWPDSVFQQTGAGLLAVTFHELESRAAAGSVARRSWPSRATGYRLCRARRPSS
jgi:putative ABC transport system substrate-binding protein